VRGWGASGVRAAAASGRCKLREGAADEWAPPDFYFSTNFESEQNFHTSKIEKPQVRTPKIMKSFEEVEETTGNNFPFWLNFKIEMDFELQILE
jgi:hypothetical protein